MQARLHSTNIELAQGYQLKAVAVEYWDEQLRRWRIYDIVPLSTLTATPNVWHELLRQQEELEQRSALQQMDSPDWLNPEE